MPTPRRAPGRPRPLRARLGSRLLRPAAAPAADYSFVQGKAAAVSAGVATVNVVLDGAAAAGNLLAFTLGGDKNTGPLTTMTDNLSGAWNVIYVDLNTGTPAAVTLYYCWKVAVGGEQTITATVTTAPSSGMIGWVGEYASVLPGTWTLLQSAHNVGVGGTTPLVWATGTTAATSQDGVGVATVCIDSTSSVTGVTGWSDGYTARFTTADSSGKAAPYVADKLLEPSGATATSTLTITGTGDEMNGAIAVFAKVAGGGVNVNADPASSPYVAADAQAALALDAGAAAVPAAAADALASIGANAEATTAPFTAAGAAVAVDAVAGTASVPFAAADAAAALAVDAGAATVGFAAADATVSTIPTTSADAGPATVPFTAADASVALDIAAGAPQAPLTAADAVAGISPTAGAASAPVAAQDAAVALTVDAGTATVPMTAADATVSTAAFTNADAGPATVTVTAADASALVAADAGTATAPFAAADAVVVNAVDVAAGAASVTVAAADAGASIGAAAGAASVPFAAAAPGWGITPGAAAVGFTAADAAAALGALATAATVAFIGADAEAFIPPPVPPPRWVEGGTAGTGLVEGAASGTGQVEGVLVGAGIVEGGSSL